MTIEEVVAQLEDLGRRKSTLRDTYNSETRELDKQTRVLGKEWERLTRETNRNGFFADVGDKVRIKSELLPVLRKYANFAGAINANGTVTINNFNKDGDVVVCWSSSDLQPHSAVISREDLEPL